MRQVIIVAFALGLVHGRGEAEAKPLPSGRRPGESFRRVATLPNYLNNLDLAAPTVSEIIAANASGDTLVYTDSLLREVGIIDITDPSAPLPAGKLFIGGEPTSVAILGDALALVTVDTSESFVTPRGHLAVVDLGLLQVIAELPLGGQPDSLTISPSRRFAAIVVENERDEERVVNDVEGGLPQAPSGFLTIVDLTGDEPAGWGVRQVELTGLASVAPEDAEPELVDVNARDEAVVTLQENNHVVLVDLPTGRVSADFAAGSVELEGVDATEDGIISLTDSLTVAREPDGVTWLPGPRGRVATANEGDLFGGSRGFSIFDRSGRVLFDSGNTLEQIAVRHGHYPERRSDARGTEPEAIEAARFGATDYLFVGSERGSFVAVYRLARGAGPELVQLLPGPLGPEGVLAVPSRNLLVVSGEEDEPSFGVRSSIMIYALEAGAPTYPQIISEDDAEGQPIAWSALSGLAASPAGGRQLLGVSDGFYSESRIFTIDASASPARITSAITVEGGSGSYDAEGIAVAPDGTFWLASEGDDEGRPNLLVQTGASGEVLREVGLPAEVEACRAATENRETLASGFEGVAVVPRPLGYALLTVQQRGWDYTTSECEALDDDPLGANPEEPSQTRLWIFEPSSGSWSSVAYRLEALPPNARWVGLSEISAVSGGFVLIERDDRSGDFAELKRLVFVSLEALTDGVVDGDEKRSFDLRPALLETRGWITDKPEGFAVTADGASFLVTDNDGVDDWSGETWFLSLGPWQQLF